MTTSLMEILRAVPEYFAYHLMLTLSALAIGWTVSVPLAILATRVRRLEGPLTGFVGMVQTIPSLALLALMVPLLGMIGFVPALAALVLYSMLPVVRNTIAGLRGVEPAYVEAARAVGMTNAQRLFRVELPLAAPTIIAGLRTSAIWTVGIATLSTPVGQQSLGHFIFMGLQTRNNAMLLVGVVAAIGLAFALDGAIRLIEVGMQLQRKALAGAGVATLGVMSLVGLSPLVGGFTADSRPTVVIGAKTFTEQHFLSELLADRFRDQAFRVVTKSGMNSALLFEALANGSVDCYVDYTGTIWTNVLRRDDAPGRRQMLVDLKRSLAREYGILSVGRLGFENTYALAMPRQQAKRLGIRSISDLRSKAPTMTIAGDTEFFGRPEWKMLQGAYDLEFASIRPMDASLMYSATQEEAVDVVAAFSSDGRIAAYDLIVLQDDRQVFPPYDAIVLFSKRAAQRQELVTTVQSLLMSIDDDSMRRANKWVDVDGRSPADAARLLWASIQTGAEAESLVEPVAEPADSARPPVDVKVTPVQIEKT